jgi:hypothetical protein
MNATRNVFRLVLAVAKSTESTALARITSKRRDQAKTAAETDLSWRPAWGKQWGESGTNGRKNLME